MENYFNQKYDTKLDVVENDFNLDIDEVLSKTLCIFHGQLYYPIISNGELQPSGKSKHFLIPMLLSKKYIETYHKDTTIYENILNCEYNNFNGTGRFFEGLSKENSPIKNTLVVSNHPMSQGFGQIFAMGLQNVDYIHINDIGSLSNKIDVNKYENITIFVNELIDDDNELFSYIKSPIFTNVKVTIACILDYTKKQYDVDIISLVKLDFSITKLPTNDSTSIISCKFPNYCTNVVQPAIQQDAVQDDNIIETIMTLMSSQDFDKDGDKIKILFVGDQFTEYLAMLISEFMSGFDKYEVYYSNITQKDLCINDKIEIHYGNFHKDEYIYNIRQKNYEFLFYLSSKKSKDYGALLETFSKLPNIQRKNILVNNRNGNLEVQQ